MKTFGSATTFHVSSVEDSLRFYTGVLGFTKRFHFGDYAGIEHGDVQIHLSGPAATNKKEIGQGSIYIFCDNVDSYYSDVSRKGAFTQSPPKDYDYGMRDFVIEDPDHNLIGIGQETPKQD